MTEHVHRLVLTDERNIICVDLECDFRLTWRQATARLNEYGTLKAATERLSAEDAKRALHRWLPADVSKAIAKYADILEGK